jgi:hypothetical protein
MRCRCPGRLIFIDGLEDVTLVVGHLKFFQELQILLAKGRAGVVAYLIPNVFDHPLQLRVAV